ncbi:LPD28 domain-containing protein [Listeria sp. ILCC797]|uniref:LPD28 domain-containing protein n=1 Tax=Listeria sp. ILCC797 TaxID=1918333 RepID=UPI000B58ADA0|nr:LPD28 domain-containing protein [Listeria sp. ILCC797]
MSNYEDFQPEAIYEEIIFNHTIHALSNILRFHRSTLPDDAYAYCVRDSDNGMDFANIAPYVMVNHSLDIICANPIEFPAVGWVDIEDWEYTGRKLTFEAFKSEQKREVDA